MIKNFLNILKGHQNKVTNKVELDSLPKLPLRLRNLCLTSKGHLYFRHAWQKERAYTRVPNNHHHIEPDGRDFIEPEAPKRPLPHACKSLMMSSWGSQGNHWLVGRVLIWEKDPFCLSFIRFSMYLGSDWFYLSHFCWLIDNACMGALF